MTQEQKAAPQDRKAQLMERRYAQLRRIRKGILFVVNTIAILIFLRFVLKALGANEANLFAQLFYAATDPLVVLFADLFGEPPTFGSPPTRNVFEFSNFVAIVVYYLVAWFIVRLLSFFMTRSPSN
jgi:uncharacterized protein YggT (Ycf19 family)